MRSHLTRFLLALGLCAAVPLAASAQDAFPRVRDELDRTAQRIERASALVTHATNAAARFELDQASTLQTGARTALANRRPRIAFGLTMRARGRADRAIALAGGLPDPDRAADQLGRSHAMLDRAMERTRACHDDAVTALLRTATDMQGRAEEAGRSGHYLAALQLTLGVQERVRQALSLCNVRDDGRDAAEDALRRTDAVLQRVQERLGTTPTPTAADALAQATRAQAEAKQHFQNEHWDDSVRRTLEARALAKRAQRIAGRDG